MMAKLSKEQLERGVICSSAGNHAQGVALSAQRLGCNAVIVMPVTTPEIKVIHCLCMSCFCLLSKIGNITIFEAFFIDTGSGNQLKDLGPLWCS